MVGHTSLSDQFARPASPLIWGFWLAITCGVAWLDNISGTNLMLWGLYLLPITLSAWFQGFRAGGVVCVMATLAMVVDGLCNGHPFSSDLYFLVALANRLAAMLAVAWLAGRVFRSQMIESTLKSYDEVLDYLHASPSPPSADSHSRTVSVADKKACGAVPGETTP